MQISRCALTAVMWLAIACGDPTAPSGAVSEGELAQQPLPTGPVAGLPWARQGCTKGQLPPDVLACVGGVAISRERFEEARAQYPDGTPVRAVLTALIDEEALSAAAAQHHLWGPWLVEPLRRAMVAAWLDRTFAANHRVDQVSRADIERAYHNPAVREMFEHVNGYFTTDAQMLCCSGNVDQCAKSDEVRSCIDAGADKAAALRAALVADPPGSPAEMAARVASLRGRFPDVGVHDIDFYYDPTIAYGDQRGYQLMVEPFAVGVSALQPGQISEPIRSPYGWHIVWLRRVLPARHGTPEDADVRSEIARNILPMLRERDLIAEVVGLARQAGVELYLERLGE